MAYNVPVLGAVRAKNIIMANKRIKKPLTQRVSIYEQEYKLKEQAKELLKKIKEDARYITLQRN